MTPSASTSATSPLSLSATLATAQDEHERDNDSSRRSTPARSSPQDLTRSRPPTRGGCWTCRIRRKILFVDVQKCDEERVDGDSCKTCNRLGIKCLGWGTRRPDWMKDKEKVAQYKADIKAQLTRAGLIRGIPRSPYNQTPNTSTPDTRGSSANAPVAPRDRYPQPAIAGPGPRTATTRIRSPRSEPYGSYGIVDQSTTFPSRPPSSSIMSALPGLGSDMSLPPFVMQQQHPYAASHPNPLPSPSLYPPNANDLFPSAAAAAASTPPYHSPHGMINGLALPHPPPPSVSPANSRLASPIIEPTEQLVGYYFEHVRKLQFAYAGQELTQVLYLILQRDPHGPLKHALCALASLHSTKLQMNGFDEENFTGGSARPMHKRYFDQGHLLLEQRRSQSGAGAGSMGTRQYPEDDAIAAVFLIGYYTMVSGGRNWLALLEIAYEWFAQSGLVEEQNPKLKLWNMSDVQRIAVKAVMWIDIQSSIVFSNTPRFLPVYRRLLGSGGGGFWASAGTGNERMDLRMDKLTGCPDEAVLTLAESAHLAYWKSHQVHNGTLSARELVRRADQIEQALRQSPFRSVSSSPTNEAGPGASSLLPSGLPAAADIFGGAAFEMTQVDEAARRAIPQVWRETAVLYLHTVMSDALPGVPEIQKSVSTLMDWFSGFSPSDLDRSLLLPLILTASLTDNPIFNDIVKRRMALHGADMMFNGAMAQASNFVDYVWQRRRNQPRGIPMDWRECMKERWSSLVMV
ncbi:fungal-specific transcription factor domain-containing protein [Irpex rosettiformis]|uniref:Fungal-specific transcription factor domain-containing protein n=1 Tax=Irpex rosettiformis TaxID=378272 RepID=A0ACB8U9E5_9APHY|nr:fungal-specific transcription factor domain-containing protein [Irpex rosettiformis]